MIISDGKRKKKHEICAPLDYLTLEDVRDRLSRNDEICAPLDYLTLENVSDRLSRNVETELTFYAA
jgi:hypothetical protein